MRPRQACLGILRRPETVLTWHRYASMRPRQACLGIRVAKPRNMYSPCLASMRPRQACLGIPERETFDERLFYGKASMRPRQACLGIRRLGRREVTMDGGFNEAEASLPRNTTVNSLFSRQFNLLQ